MKLFIEECKDQEEVEITIRCASLDERLRKLIEHIRSCSLSIKGTWDNETRNIPLEEIYYFESVDDTTYIYCASRVYCCDKKLYELEKLLCATSFLRISKSVILNVDCLSSVKPLFDGKFEAALNNGEIVVVNRHYVKQFKKKFNV